MEKKLKLPIGIENFSELRKRNYYYVDKTELIEQVLEDGSQVILFTRPRRFGKSLNMSMLKSFFEKETDPALFEGLYIAQNIELCRQYMGQYPVISISLKGVDSNSYEGAYKLLVQSICDEIERFQFLIESNELTQIDKKRYFELIDRKMEPDTLAVSLKGLTLLLEKHYHQKVVVLIDEYDVPLAKAYENGYYDEMILLIRNLFGNVLKTNDSLAFAVLTGCLRIAKESIFTGLNNFKVYSITDDEFDETFGFTNKEVMEMLQYYGLSDRFDEVKEWYDGYHFGKADIYCPWDVINYVDQLKYDKTAEPQDFWSNSSGNAIVRRFIDMADVSTKTEIERLIAGESIEKDVAPELTYDEIYKSIENLWSVLFTTGYLTHNGRTESGKYCLVIPNREIRNLFVKKIKEWFSDVSKSDGKTLEELCSAFVNEDAQKIEQIYGEYLWNTISIRDTAVAKEKKENFYHGILLGLLGYKSNWLIKSNAESGIGYSDILVEVPTNRTGIVIELKYAEDGDLDAACDKALKQIEEKDYVAKLKQDGMDNFIKYGIACFKKVCKVVC